ncbi:MAG: PHP domain-containing protein [Anaerolineae bacterium]|nr:PHP domain-containing protein [Anaerolineae bacterium]
MLNLELHSHTQYSPDSLSKLPDVIAQCRKVGIDRIAITDHSEIRGALQAHNMAPDLVIVGEEVMTTQGELLCYFITELIPPYLSPEEACERVHAQGGIIGPSHPFDPRRSGLGRNNLLRIAEKIDFIEVFNARTYDKSKNDLAHQLAEELDKPMICCSDAHTLKEIGVSRTCLHRDYTSPQDFLAALREADYVPHTSSHRVSLKSTAASIVKGFGFRQPDL